ncbi:hypothetical protein Pan216_05050 [Planctomycetes bacterium Pan216]|uniref:Uncharacterized protein n=1 Tax=Kolteria novifilia TaxID=2527975 RepID=A0A518AY73_9BACT|nr:hypothetical protein Pan216_05050 [Planctomycetes bacterium Pan216]
MGLDKFNFDELIQRFEDALEETKGESNPFNAHLESQITKGLGSIQERLRQTLAHVPEGESRDALDAMIAEFPSHQASLASTMAELRSHTVDHVQESLTSVMRLKEQAAKLDQDKKAFKEKPLHPPKPVFNLDRDLHEKYRAEVNALLEPAPASEEPLLPEFSDWAMKSTDSSLDEEIESTPTNRPRVNLVSGPMPLRDRIVEKVRAKRAERERNGGKPIDRPLVSGVSPTPQRIPPPASTEKAPSAEDASPQEPTWSEWLSHGGSTSGSPGTEIPPKRAKEEPGDDEWNDFLKQV